MCIEFLTKKLRTALLQAGVVCMIGALIESGLVMADDTFPFPSEGSTVIGSLGFIDTDEIGWFWSVNRGDQVSESFTSSCTSGIIESATLNLDVVNNVLRSGAFVDWDFSLNGTSLGGFTIPHAFTGGVLVPANGVVVGPDFNVKIEVTNEVAFGEGSHTYAYSDPYLHAVTLQCLGAYATVGGKTVCTGGNDSSGDGDGNGQFNPISACDGEAMWQTDTFVSGFIGLTSDAATGSPDSFPYSGTPISLSEINFMTKHPSRGYKCTYTPGTTSIATIAIDRSVLSNGWIRNCWDSDDLHYDVDIIESRDIILINATGSGKGRDKDRGTVCFGFSGTGVCAHSTLSNYMLVRGEVASAQE